MITVTNTEEGYVLSSRIELTPDQMVKCDNNRDLLSNAAKDLKVNHCFVVNDGGTISMVSIEFSKDSDVAKAVEQISDAHKQLIGAINNMPTEYETIDDPRFHDPLVQRLNKWEEKLLEIKKAAAKDNVGICGTMITEDGESRTCCRYFGFMPVHAYTMFLLNLKDND